jgi:hypothetical protein
MFNLVRDNFVIVFVRTDPFDPNNTLLEIDRYDKPIIIALNVEHDSLRADYARAGIEALQVRGAAPRSLANFVEPSVERALDRRPILSPREAIYESPQTAPSDDPHARHLSRSQFGIKRSGFGARFCVYSKSIAENQKTWYGPSLRDVRKHFLSCVAGPVSWRGFLNRMAAKSGKAW